MKVIPPWQYWAFFYPGLILIPAAMLLPLFWATVVVMFLSGFMATGAFYAGITAAKSQGGVA